MIEPTKEDIGRKVIYRAMHPKAKPEQGVITSYNDSYVFVRYGSQCTSQATLRSDLIWSVRLPGDAE